MERGEKITSDKLNRASSIEYNKPLIEPVALHVRLKREGKGLLQQQQFLFDKREESRKKNQQKTGLVEQQRYSKHQSADSMTRADEWKIQ